MLSGVADRIQSMAATGRESSRSGWGLFGGVALLLIVGACGAPAEPGTGDAGTVSSSTTATTVPQGTRPVTPTTTVPPVADLVAFPELHPVDPGVLSDVVFITSDEQYSDLFDSLAVEASAAPGAGTALELSECRLRAPGRWVYRGTATLPEGVESARVGVYLNETRGDLGTGFPLVATVTGPGDFAIAVDRTTLGDPDRPFTMFDDSFGSCSLTIARADGAAVPSASGALEPTRVETPLRWTAPADSIQALGMGAVLGDRTDWRLSWAYSTYLGERLPFATLWLPPEGGYSLSRWNVDEETACRFLVVESDTEQIVFSTDCDWGLDLASGERTALAGWVIASEPGGRPGIATERDGVIIQLQPAGSAEVDIAALVDIAATLTPFRNVGYSPEAPPLGASEDLEAAVAAVLDAGGWTERGRFRLGDGWIVVATRIGESDEGEAAGRIYAVVGEFRARRIGSGEWVVTDNGGGGGSDFCLRAWGSGDPEASYFVAFTAEPDWTIQVRRDGTWQDLPAVDGFYARVGGPDEVEFETPLRALDGDGRVVRCSTEGNFLEAGEEWSPYRPADSMRDRQLSIDPAAGLADGTIVTVAGSGYYPNTGIEVRVCAAEAAGWDDWADCADVGEPSFTRSDSGGDFQVDVPVTAGFTTWSGVDVDCLVDDCILRADTNTGIHQYGWVPLPFGT